MRIYLIRHARQESILCNDNTGLSEIGKEQATLVGQRLSSYHIDALYCSDLMRAKETAHIIQEQICKRMNQILSIQERRGLRESDFGELTGQKDEDIQSRYGEFMESRYHEKEDWAYPGGESGKQVFNRVKPVLDEITAASYKNIAIVTHGGTIRVILAELLQGSQANRLLFGKYLERGGFTELYYDEKKKRFYLERFNDYAHLEIKNDLLMRKE
ncbi:histidine phosphatase family protein [Anaeromicropila populeti]|uniref:phosphoglycerate mutase (2,3-diphosphoglycerate-dependent) n=1 Tax=Anaeromicropila populeti TaxID=37658 RepID=A0A1I6JLM9_9FIRM|nr:histidine phosphatase family protein [Anaeromicropila populeti]SFR79883.1 probable phosphoglycerate mutase [Anaeromicropila populeti]